MSKEALYEALEMINEIRYAITYLKENKEILVENGLNNLLSNQAIYLKELQSNNNLEKFKNSILNGHIKWVLEDMYNPNEIDFNQYNEDSLFTFSKAYCDFYKLLTNDIKKIEDKKIREILEDYFYAFSEMYCS